MPEHARVQVAQKALITKGAEPSVLTVRYGPEGRFQWDLPGGRVECGEMDLDAALVREVSEEVGLLVEPGPTLDQYLDIHPANGEPALYLVRACRVLAGELTTTGQVPADCITAAGWLSFTGACGSRNPVPAIQHSLRRVLGRLNAERIMKA